MSNWTDEKHRSARKEAEGFIGHGGHRIRNITLSDALDEIERLRALNTITDNMVERAAREIYGPTRWDSEISFLRSPNGPWPHLAHNIYRARDKARDALEAALSPNEDES